MSYINTVLPRYSQPKSSENRVPSQKSLSTYFGGTENKTSSDQSLSDGYGLALKQQVLFGSTFEPQHPKLTYTHERTISDPILGNIEVYKFSNGMEFYGIQRDDVPLVAFGELSRAGSINERAKENGVAHFLEHLIISKSHKHLERGEFMKRTEDLGGAVNGFTNKDHTFYYTYNLPKESLREAMALRAEMIQNATVPQDELDSERTTVTAEIGRANGNVNNEMWYRMNELVWGDSPLRRTILGPEKVIQTISRDAVMDYYYKFYAPENRAIIMAGDFDMKEALDMVAEEYNIPFPTRNSPSNRSKLKPLYAADDRDHVLERNVRSAQMGVFFDGPREIAPENMKERLALDIASLVLGGGQSSRLYKTLVEDQSLADNAYAYFYETKTRSVFNMGVSSDPKNLDTIRAEVDRQLDRLIQDGITEEELQKAKKLLRADVAEGTETLYSLIRSLPSAVSNNTLDYNYGNALTRAESVTVEDVQAAAKKYLQPDTAYSLRLVPKQQEESKTQSVRFGGALTQAQVSKTTPTGTEVLLHQKKQALRSSITVKVRGGQSVEKTPGEIALLVDMLARGTDNVSAQELQAQLESNGLDFSTTYSKDGITLTMKGDSEDHDRMYATLQELFLSGPAFRLDDLDHVKRQYKQRIIQALDSQPSNYSWANVSRKLFPGTPFSISAEQKLEHLDDITPESLQVLYNKLFNPKNMTVAMTRAGSQATQAAQLDEISSHVASWFPQAVDQPALETDLPAIAPLTESTLVTKAVKTVEEMPLSEIVRAWHVPTLNETTSRARLLVMHRILTGGLSTRLFQTFREGPHGGLCYSVKSDPSLSMNTGQFSFYVGTKHKNTPLALQLFQEEVDKLTDALPSESEVKKAKLQLKSKFLSSEQATDDISGGLSAHRMLDIPSKWELLDAIDQVTAEDIQAFAQTYLSRPSVTAITAPAEALEQHGLPVDGEKVLSPGSWI